MSMVNFGAYRQSSRQIKNHLRLKTYSEIVLTGDRDFTEYVDIFSSLDFSNLKKLTFVGGKNIQQEQLESIFQSCPNLVNVVCYYKANILESLYVLHKLDSLTITDIPDDKVDTDLCANLENLHSLTKLTIQCESKVTGNKILNAFLLNTVLFRERIKQLFLNMPCDNTSIRKVKGFTALEHLSMGPLLSGEITSGTFNGFPKNLKNMKIDKLRIHIDDFLTIVNSLRLLTVFNVGEGEIYMQHGSNEMGIESSIVSDQLVRKLGLHQTKRSLAIVYIRKGKQYEDVYCTNLPQIKDPLLKAIQDKCGKHEILRIY